MVFESHNSQEETATLEGTTLAVYTFVAKTRWPVGTRDVVRNLGLSSSSVAFRHLQKLEVLGLISKTASGEYVLKAKAKVHGYLWAGRYLLPRMLVYAFFFLAALAVEIVILFWHFEVENYEFKVFFSLLALITTAAVLMFLVEGVRTLLRSKRATA